MAIAFGAPQSGRVALQNQANLTANGAEPLDPDWIIILPLGKYKCGA